MNYMSIGEYNVLRVVENHLHPTGHYVANYRFTSLHRTLGRLGEARDGKQKGTNDS